MQRWWYDGPRRVLQSGGRGGEMNDRESRPFLPEEQTMKPAVAQMVDSTPTAVGRRSFFKTLGVGAAGALALTGRGRGRRRGRFRAVQRQTRLRAIRPEDHRPARGGRRGRADDVPARSASTRTRASSDGARSATARARRTRCSLKSRVLGENPCNVDKIFRKIKQFGAAGAAGRRRVRHRDGADGPGRARPGACRAGRCSAGSSAIAYGSMPTRPRVRTRKTRAGCSKSAWTAASRT